MGDMNIAPEPRDVHDPALWEGQVLFSEPERAVFREWLGLGLVDGFRRFDQPPNTFSWWDYRMLGVPQEPRPAHRPHPALHGARRALHGVPHRPQCAEGREAERPRAGDRRAADRAYGACAQAGLIAIAAEHRNDNASARLPSRRDGPCSTRSRTSSTSTSATPAPAGGCPTSRSTSSPSPSSSPDRSSAGATSPRSSPRARERLADFAYGARRFVIRSRQESA